MWKRKIMKTSKENVQSRLQGDSPELFRSNVATVWSWLSSLCGKNKQRYEKLCTKSKSGLTEVHEELCANAKILKETTWDKLKVRYVRAARKRRRSIKQGFRTKRDSVYNKMDEFRSELKEAVKDEWSVLKQVTRVNTQFLLDKATSAFLTFVLIAPLIAAIVYTCLKVPELLYGAVAYVSFLAVFLFKRLAMPSLKKNGVTYFSRRELTEEDVVQVKELLNRINVRSQGKPKQRLYTEEDREKPMFILSLDGGGIKGITVSEIINRICLEFPDFLDNVDLVAGCSTGSIVAAMLCSGYTPEEVSQTFRIAAPVVFRKTVWDSLKNLGEFLLSVAIT
uniref:PNPLA domain-containing protein n=1 Tax=Aplanochytrium stocchinoi TaxID=215587 RepID=A0A7S3UYC5_9STRA